MWQHYLWSKQFVIHSDHKSLKHLKGLVSRVGDMPNSDSNVKCTTIQFHSNSYNSQLDRLIGLKFYVKSPDILSYLWLKFQVNQSLGRYHNSGQQRLFEFCYLVMILFLKGRGNLFWESPSFTKIFNGLQHSFKCGKDSSENYSFTQLCPYLQ